MSIHIKDYSFKVRDYLAKPATRNDNRPITYRVILEDEAVELLDHSVRYEYKRWLDNELEKYIEDRFDEDASLHEFRNVLNKRVRRREQIERQFFRLVDSFEPVRIDRYNIKASSSVPSIITTARRGAVPTLKMYSNPVLLPMAKKYKFTSAFEWYYYVTWLIRDKFLELERVGNGENFKVTLLTYAHLYRFNDHGLRHHIPRNSAPFTYHSRHLEREYSNSIKDVSLLKVAENCALKMLKSYFKSAHDNYLSRNYPRLPKGKCPDPYREGFENAFIYHCRAMQDLVGSWDNISSIKVLDNDQWGLKGDE